MWTHTAGSAHEGHPGSEQHSIASWQQANSKLDDWLAGRVGWSRRARSQAAQLGDRWVWGAARTRQHRTIHSILHAKQQHVSSLCYYCSMFRARMSCWLLLLGTCCAGSHEIPSFFYCYSLRYFKKYLPNILVKSCYTGYIWQKARVPRESFTMSCFL